MTFSFRHIVRPALFLSLLGPSLAIPVLRAQAAQTQDAQPDAPWMLALAARHQQLIDKGGPGTDPSLSQRLLGMLKTDQDARNKLLQQAAPGVAPDTAQLQPTDTALTAELKLIVLKYGWPTIPLVGFDASNAAMLILTHTADHAWQQSLLPSLEKLAAQDKIDGSVLALVVDKELVAAGHPQRYGTQFKFTGKTVAMYAVEDPTHLDARRAAAMLPPIDVYKSMIAAAYGMQASDQVVAP